MKYLTRNGVATSLAHSPYIFTEIINGKQIDFHFSSNLHMKNFVEKRDDNYNMIYNYIYKRFKFKTDCRLLSDCNLYRKIETRGFYIKYNNKEFLCPNNITLNGGLRMKENLEGWSETSITS